MTENNDNKAAFVNYRIEKSEEAYYAAQILYNENQWNAAVNRLYYACFYIASALLLQRNIGAKSHGGIMGKFSETVIRTNELNIDDFRVYSKLLSWRTKGDYTDMFDFSKQDLDDVFMPTRVFIDKTKSLIFVNPTTETI